MKKKVVHMFPAYKIGGAPINILRFIKNTTSIYDHYSIGKNEDNSFFQKYKKYTLHSFDIDITKFSFRSACLVISKINDISPEIIHVNGKGGALYGFFIKIFCKKKIVFFYTFRGFHIKYNSIISFLYIFFESIFIRLVNRGIAVSTSEKKFYQQKVKVPKNKVFVIPNGIELKKEELPQNIKNITSKYNINIITLSRISYEKDLITMLQVFKKYNKKNTSLHIIGGYMEKDIAYKNKIDDLIHKLEHKNVYFWNEISNAGNLIHHFDLYWSTSLFEGLPTAIIEAMMSKVLVVATNCRGNIDIVKHNKTGFLTEIQNIEDIFEKMAIAVDMINNQTQNEIVDNAFKYCKKFSIENHIKKLIFLYENP